MIKYDEIEKLLLSTLDQETPESLKVWLDNKKAEEMLADLGEGEYHKLESETSEFQHCPNNTRAGRAPLIASETNYCLAA